MSEDTETTPQQEQARVPVSHEEQLAARDAEVADLKDRLLRQIAETENVRRRIEKEKVDAGQYAMAGFARDLLGVVDNFRRALAAVPAEARADATITSILVGVEMTDQELTGVLGRHGVVPVPALGTKYDANLHQAMLEVESAEVEPGTVVQVLQEGYKIRDRLLRPAMVAVAKAPGQPAASGGRVDTHA